jgi:teichuronic acid biosynthesis glycosyltransferase TuaC
LVGGIERADPRLDRLTDLELNVTSPGRPRRGLPWAALRVLLVTNLYPDAASPRRGRFVSDQVEALRALGAEIELFTFPLGSRAYLSAVRPLRRRLSEASFDVVHAHYGLCGWTAARAGASPLLVTFHGTDVRHPLSGRVSRSVLRKLDLAAGVSSSIFRAEAGRPGLDPPPGTAAVLPAGVDLSRFSPAPRAAARRRLGLEEDGRYLFFPADPARTVKRADRAREVAGMTGATLLTAGEIDPQRMADHINAASAVLVTSDSEGFGLAALEALACEVPVLSTPVGIAPLALAGLPGCLAEPFDATRWAAVASSHLEADDPRVERGAEAAAAFSATRMAERVLAAYEGLAARRRDGGANT